MVQIKSLFCLACLTILAWQPSLVNGQAVVRESRSLVIPAHYEKVLSRLDGMEASSEMFASQKVALQEYKPRKVALSPNSQQEEGVTRASVDIVGYSHEFGTMCYLMSVVATEKQTTINVQLVNPVGILRHQQYCYKITPQGENATVITISHELDVVLMSRKLQLVNRIVSKVTYKKACENLHELTGKIADSVYCIANREKPKTDTSNDNSSGNDDEELEEAVDEDAMKDESNSVQKNVEPPAESKKVESGDSSSKSPDKVSAALNHNDSLKNLAGSNSSMGSPPVPNSPDENRDRTSDKDTAADLSRVERSTSEAQSAQTPRSENATPVVPQPVTSKGPAKSTASETERIKEKNDASLSPLAVPSPTQSNTPTPAQQEPIKPKGKDLRVVIEGVTTTSGTIRIAVFANDKQFKAFDARKDEDSQGEVLKKVSVRIKQSGTLIYDFKGIPHGTYAIAAFHDQDGNKKLNSSFIGLPSEPYGFTRDARNSFGVPRYEDAVVKYDEMNSSFEFKLK